MSYPEIKVFDMDDNERDFAYVQAKYGVAFRRYAAQPGQTVYRLVELREKTGHTSLITQVLDKGGRPLNGKDVAFYWPTAPSPPDPPTALLTWDWYKNFVHGATNLNGDVGPGMGKGAYHGEGEGGPHAVWVRDSAFPSDICEKLGMLAGTFHDHLDQKFQRIVEGESGPTPEPPPSPEPEPPPQPPPQPTGGWQMKIDRKPGAKVIAGNLPTAGVAMIITAPNGRKDSLASGHKGEHGIGGFESMAWGSGLYIIEFLGQRFEVAAGKEFVFATFTFTEGPAPSTKRIVSKSLPQEEAENIFEALQGSYPGVFSLE